jgi:hypothetical protein
MRFYILCFLFVFIYTVVLNVGWLECSGYPLSKSDVDNYGHFIVDHSYEGLHVLITHEWRLFSWLFGWTPQETIWYTSSWKHFLILPICLFLYFAAATGNPRQSVHAILILYLASWWTHTHLWLGLHGQFQAIMYYLLFMSGYHLYRRGAHGFELQVLMLLAGVMSVLTHHYVIFAYIMWIVPKYPRAGVCLSALIGYMYWDQIIRAFGFGGVNVWSAILVAGPLYFGLIYPRGCRRTTMLVMTVFGVLSIHHRLILYVLPDLALELTKVKKQWWLKIYCLFGVVWHPLWWLVNLRYEILMERPHLIQSLNECFYGVLGF